MRFISAGQAEVSFSELGDSLARFVEEVIAKLFHSGVRDTALEREWRQVTNLVDQDELAFVQAAAALGLDPFNIDADIEKSLYQAAGVLSSDDFQVFVNSADPDKIESDLAWIEKSSAALADISLGNYEYRQDKILSLRSGLRDFLEHSESNKPWDYGWNAAAFVRRALTSDLRERINLDEILPHVEILSPDQGIVAVAGTTDRSSGVVIGQSRTSAGVRFIQARALWRVLQATGDNTRIVIGHSHDRTGQVERAFAAELLAPAEAIRESLRDGVSDIEGVASQFDASVRVVEHQIENQIVGSGFVNQ